MDDQAYQAAMVRSLLVPGQIARERGDGHDAVDWETVSKFAGFITAVRHNFLWEVLPLTRRFLHQAKLEIDVFADWADRHLELRSARSSKTKQVEAFVSFLNVYCARHELAWLKYVLLHEHALWRLREAREGEAQAGVVASPEGIPHVNGRVTSVALPAPPAEIINRGEAALSGHELGEDVSTLRWFVYAQKAPADEIRISEADVVHVTLLSAIDGRRSAEAIAAAVFGVAESATAVSYFDSLTAAGFVRWQLPQ
jgi:hypothetical protein